MTDDSRPADPHLSIGAYVLHSLPADEREAFEAHLAGCESCVEQVDGLRATAALLGAAEAVRPPVDLRERVLTAASSTRQDPPALPTPGPAGPSGSATPVSTRPAAWYRRPAGALAAAAAVIVVGGGITLAVLGGRSPELTASQRMEQCVTADHSAATMAPSIGAGGSLIRSERCSAVMVTLPAMPAPPRGMAYQVWMVTDQSPKSMGMVHQLGGAVMPMTMQPGDSTVAVTVEPMAGSKQPTGQPVWAVPLH